MKAAVGAVKAVRSAVLPSDFYDESVCGCSPRLFLNDLGENCTLSKLRSLTNCLFNYVVILHRILKAMLVALKKGMQRQNKRKTGTSVNTAANTRQRKSLETYTEHASILLITPSLLSLYAEDPQVDSFSDGKICWASDLTPKTNTEQLPNREGWLLYQALMQGPATQFCRKTEIPSLLSLSQLCDAQEKSAVLQCLSNREETLMDGIVGGDLPSNHNILHHLRLIVGGVFSAFELQQRRKDASEGLLEQDPSSVPKQFGYVLQEVSKCAENFYKLYDEALSRNTNRSSALQYASRWNIKDQGQLLQATKQSHPDEISSLSQKENEFERACSSGIYFPFSLK